MQGESKKGARRQWPLSNHTIGVLSRAVAERISEFPLSERIRIYQALGESLPADGCRSSARELARIFSRAAAMELEFQERVKRGHE
jgi:hypothetical protein